MHLIRRSLLLALAIAGTIAPVAHAHPTGAHPPGASHPQDADVVKAVEGTRVAIQKAVFAKDAPALQRLYTASFVHTHGSGKVDGRAERIVSLLTGEPVVELAPVEDHAIAQYEGHAAVVRGKSPILNVRENQYYQFRWIQVYVNEGGQWKLAASQATRLADPPVPATDAKATAMRQISMAR